MAEVAPGRWPSEAAFGWVVVASLAVALGCVVGWGEGDGTGLAVVAAGLLALSLWSVDGRFYRRDRFRAEWGRVVVRSVGLFGTWTRFDATAGDVRACAETSLTGLGPSAVVVTDGASGRSVRIGGLSDADAVRLAALLDRA